MMKKTKYVNIYDTQYDIDSNEVVIDLLFNEYTYKKLHEDLAKFKKLKVLYIFNSKSLYDYSVINKLNTLTDITISDVSKLKLKNVRNTNVKHLTLTDIKNRINIKDVYNSFPNIKYLTIFSCNTYNYKYINSFDSLEYLSMIRVGLKSIKWLNNTNIKFLKLNDNNIKFITGINRLHNLNTLIIDDNEITKIPKTINDLKKLEVLSLSNNKISKIENINKLINLEKLSLRYNKIKRIEGLDNNMKLKELNLRNNEIEKIEGLNNNRLLKNLVLNENNISIIENIHHLKDLKLFYIYSRDPEDAEKLKQVSLVNGRAKKLENI